MEAPDKIYLGIRELDTGYVYALSLDNNGEQEYIRKDALLEWTNKELKDNVGQYHNDYDLALSSLIDKLNEM